MKFSVATTILVLAAGVMGAAYPEPNEAGAEAVSCIIRKTSTFNKLTHTSASNCLVTNLPTNSACIIILNYYSVLPPKPRVLLWPLSRGPLPVRA
jgi:hypothetical protein